MKIIKLLTLALALILSINSNYAQKVKATIKQTDAFTATVYARSSTPYNVQIGNINLCISIPDQTLTAGTNPADNDIIKTLLPNNVVLTTQGITNPYIIGNRAYYTYVIVSNTSTDVPTNWPADTDNPVMSFAFPNGASYFPDIRLSDFFFDGGGPTFGMYWYVQLNGGVGEVADENPFYGDGAVNNGSTAEQYVPIQLDIVPVRFLGFSATKVDNAALLNWQIENESAKTVSYEIERSTNGVDFVKIATVLAKNNGSSSNAYEITDNGIASLSTASVAYYRVKQIDVDGKFVYTTIKSIRLNSKAMLVGVYPNPVKNNANLTIDITEDKMISLQITDATGKEIRRSQFQVVKGINNKKIEMNGLSAGNYLFKIIAGEEIKTIPVIKAN